MYAMLMYCMQMHMYSIHMLMYSMNINTLCTCELSLPEASPLLYPSPNPNPGPSPSAPTSDPSVPFVAFVAFVVQLASWPALASKCTPNEPVISRV